MANKPTISVIGLGFVGLSLAVVNAKNGFNTIGVDTDSKRLSKLKKGIPPFYENRLEQYLKQSLKEQTLNLTYSYQQGLSSDIVFLTVGTPQDRYGNANLSYLEQAIDTISESLKQLNTETKQGQQRKRKIIVVKSTVPPTTTRNVILPRLSEISDKVGIVVNPEFLREGFAIMDLLTPHTIVVGYNDKMDYDVIQDYHHQFFKGKLFQKKKRDKQKTTVTIPQVIKTDPTTAEMIKYANNAFLATKISFINSIANICQKLPNADVNKVAYAIGLDPRIGPEFLKAGPGFGGSCLPKDLAGLVGITNQLAIPNQLFEAVRKINENQYLQIVNLLDELKLLKEGATVSILGVAFKKDTDDIREAVSIKLAEDLLKRGIKIKVHDPMALDNFKKLFKNKVTYSKTVPDCIRNTDCCIILTEWDEYKQLTPQTLKANLKKPNVIDARRILDPSKFAKLNFKAIGLGPKEHI